MSEICPCQKLEIVEIQESCPAVYVVKCSCGRSTTSWADKGWIKKWFEDRRLDVPKAIEAAMTDDCDDDLDLFD